MRHARAAGASSVDRADERRGGGRHDRARAREQPADGAQVAEERVPHGAPRPRGVGVARRGRARRARRGRPRSDDHDAAPTIAGTRAATRRGAGRRRAPARAGGRASVEQRRARRRGPGRCSREPREVAASRRRCRAEQRRRRSVALELGGERRAEHSQRRGRDGADVDERQRDRVLVAREDRAGARRARRGGTGSRTRRRRRRPRPPRRSAAAPRAGRAALGSTSSSVTPLGDDGRGRSGPAARRPRGPRTARSRTAPAARSRRASSRRAAARRARRAPWPSSHAHAAAR